MARVRELLKKAGKQATVKVTYFLVCPEDGSKRQWRMPTGWDEDAIINDHRGDAFCIRIPVSGSLGMLYFFTPDLCPS